jgi:hypothetical protein
MPEPLSIIVGKELSSVQFVLDYVQFRFDADGIDSTPCLTVTASMHVGIEGVVFKKGQPGFRDALCERIGKTVKGARSLPERFQIEFSDTSTFVVSLSSDDRVGPEAVLLQDGSRSIFVWP